MTISTCSKKYDSDIHCQISNECHGWGCKHLLGIGFENSCYQFIHWYSFGHFSDNYTKWIVDKKMILQKITQESEFLKLSKCRHFNLQIVEKKINSLPDEITIDCEEWMTTFINGELKGIIPFTERNLDRNNP